MEAKSRKGFVRQNVPPQEFFQAALKPTPLLGVGAENGIFSVRTVELKGDVLALTKLNYNACIFGDGVPVTLRFAEAVGEILTAAPRKNELPPLPFRYYI